MNKYYILIGVLLAIMIVGQIYIKDTKKKKEIYPYSKKKILTAAELNFYNVLMECVPTECKLLAKVRLWDIIDVSISNNKITYENKIKSKHIDFIICDKETNTVLAIELDDSSHQKATRIKRDEFIDKAFLAAGIKILHITASNVYSKDELKEKICNTINE